MRIHPVKSPSSIGLRAWVRSTPRLPSIAPKTCVAAGPSTAHPVQLTAYGPSSIYRSIGEDAMQKWRRPPLQDYVRWSGHLLCSSDISTFAARARAKFPTAGPIDVSPTALPASLSKTMAFDASSGCCDMRAAVRTVADSIESRLCYRSGLVTRILYDGDKASGVELFDGNTLSADLLVVAAGAWVTELLPDLLTSGRVRLSGQVVGELDLRPVEVEYFAAIPVRRPAALS